MRKFSTTSKQEIREVLMKVRIPPRKNLLENRKGNWK